MVSVFELTIDVSLTTNFRHIGKISSIAMNYTDRPVDLCLVRDEVRTDRV